MNTYRVYSRGEERQVQAVGHREAARKCGPVSPGEALWVDGPVDEYATGKATIHFTAILFVIKVLRADIRKDLHALIVYDDRCTIVNMQRFKTVHSLFHKLLHFLLKFQIDRGRDISFTFDPAGKMRSKMRQRPSGRMESLRFGSLVYLRRNDCTFIQSGQYPLFESVHSF